MTKVFEAQLIRIGKDGIEQGITWRCEHEHDAIEDARKCLRDNSPSEVERVVEVEPFSSSKRD